MDKSAKFQFSFCHRTVKLLNLMIFLNLFFIVFPHSAISDQDLLPSNADAFRLPKSLSLCGEPLPLESRHVWEMLDQEFAIAVHDRAQVFL